MQEFKFGKKKDNEWVSGLWKGKEGEKKKTKGKRGGDRTCLLIPVFFSNIVCMTCTNCQLLQTENDSDNENFQHKSGHVHAMHRNCPLHQVCSQLSIGSQVMIKKDMVCRKWILHVMECDSTVQYICSHFNCTTKLYPVACQMHLAHAIFYVRDLHKFKSHDWKGYGTQKMNLRCYGM